jgi:hypothetical protein
MLFQRRSSGPPFGTLSLLSPREKVRTDQAARRRPRGDLTTRASQAAPDVLSMPARKLTETAFDA